MADQYSTWTTWAGMVPWWYTEVPGKIAKHQKLLLYTIVDFFSFEILLRTLFQPWKRDEQSTERLSLADRVQIWGFNLIARFFGFVMRSMALVVGALTVLIYLGFCGFLWLSWVLGPFVGFALIALGLLTMSGMFT